MHICTFLNKIRIFLKIFLDKLHLLIQNCISITNYLHSYNKTVAGNANVTLINMHLSIFHSLCINRIEWNRIEIAFIAKLPGRWSMQISK